MISNFLFFSTIFFSGILADWNVGPVDLSKITAVQIQVPGQKAVMFSSAEVKLVETVDPEFNLKEFFVPMKEIISKVNQESGNKMTETELLGACRNCTVEKCEFDYPDDNGGVSMQPNFYPMILLFAKEKGKEACFEDRLVIFTYTTGKSLRIETEPVYVRRDNSGNSRVRCLMVDCVHCPALKEGNGQLIEIRGNTGGVAAISYWYWSGASDQLVEETSKGYLHMVCFSFQFKPAEESVLMLEDEEPY